MGLDIRTTIIDPDGPHAQWSYTGFNHFRTRLASAANIDLQAMKGYIPNGKDWPAPTDEPLVYLLDHSDCDGTLGYTEAEALIPRLAELLPVAFPGDSINDGYELKMGRELIAACEALVNGDAHEIIFQ